VFFVITNAISQILETSVFNEREPTGGVTLTLHLVTLTIFDNLTLPLAELPQHFEV
jgi:hypothetical protein